MLNWICTHWIEITGALLGLLFIFLEIRQHILLWPVGLATSAFYIFVFYSAKFYADMSLQFYYILISIYGWYWWLYGKKNHESGIPVTHVPQKTTYILLAFTSIATIAIALFLINYTDSPVPIADAFTTACSIAATWMLARKYLEQWLVWVGVNAISVGLYLYKELYPTSILFIVYTVMAVYGYYEWKKTMKPHKL
jgi:nicotinamide mononucleotide transporter